MAYSVTPTSGIGFSGTVPTNTNSYHATGAAATTVPTVGPLGLQVFGSDGKRYVLAKAADAITISGAAVIDTTTFAASANGSGTYTNASGVVLAAGDYAWFSKASV